MTANVIQLPHEVERGIALINRGEYFKAHEELELSWRREKNEVRQLYQGLVQVSVILYHLERGNKKGALKLLRKALENLTPFIEFSTNLDIPRLVSDLASLSAILECTNEGCAKTIPAHVLRLHTRNLRSE